MRRGTGRIIFWAAATVVGGAIVTRKAGIRVPGFNS